MRAPPRAPLALAGRLLAARAGVGAIAVAVAGLAVAFALLHEAVLAAGRRPLGQAARGVR